MDECKSLSNPYTTPAPKSAKDVYLAATTGKCGGCGAWTPLLNKLTCTMTCWTCLEAWKNSGQLMIRSKVRVCGGTRRASIVLRS